MTTKITIVFRHKGLHQPLMTPQSHCNNERSQFSASVPPIETSQFLFPTHFVANVWFFTPSFPWIRSMDLTHGSGWNLNFQSALAITRKLSVRFGCERFRRLIENRGFRFLRFLLFPVSPVSGFEQIFCLGVRLPDRTRAYPICHASRTSPKSWTSIERSTKSNKMIRKSRKTNQTKDRKIKDKRGGGPQGPQTMEI